MGVWVTSADRRATALLQAAVALLAASLLAGCAGSASRSRASKSIPYQAPVAAKASAPAGVAPGPALAPAEEPARIRQSAKLILPSRPSGATCRSCEPPDVLLINKQMSLAAWDVPEDLVETRIPFLQGKGVPRHYLRAAAARAAERMFAAASAAGHRLYGISGFRSFDLQRYVFGNNARAAGSLQKANLVSALPGQSEHQSGLALDLTSAAAGYRLNASFGDSPAAEWLRRHAAQFGYILRYPKGKEAITGYRYEPWHWRYVGRTAAEDIARGGLALEEYLASPRAAASVIAH